MSDPFAAVNEILDNVDTVESLPLRPHVRHYVITRMWHVFASGAKLRELTDEERRPGTVPHQVKIMRDEYAAKLKTIYRRIGLGVVADGPLTGWTVSPGDGTWSEWEQREVPETVCVRLEPSGATLTCSAGRQRELEAWLAHYMFDEHVAHMVRGFMAEHGIDSGEVTRNGVRFGLGDYVKERGHEFVSRVAAFLNAPLDFAARELR